MQNKNKNPLYVRVAQTVIKKTYSAAKQSAPYVEKGINTVAYSLSSTKLRPVSLRIQRTPNLSRGVLEEASRIDASELVGKKRQY